MRTLAICRDPRGEKLWKLGPLPPPHGAIALVRIPRQDEDVEPVEHRILARALCSVARVTFPREPVEPPLPETWEVRGERHVVALPLGPARAWTRRLGERLGFHETRGLVSTRRPENVTALFEDPGWSLEGVMGLLSAPDAAPPTVTAEQLDALLAPTWTEAALALATENVIGAVRPGVDGDVAGLFATSPSFLDRVVDAIAREAEKLGVPHAFVSEAEL